MRYLSLALCFAIIGCGETDPEGDLPDAGSITVDAGQVLIDSGPASDPDGGAEGVDASTPPAEDAGEPPVVDAGEPPAADAGAMTPDTGNGGGGGGGTLSCIDAMQCSMQCQDRQCVQDCVSRAEPGANQEAARAMYQCMDRNNCLESGNLQQCMMRSCMSEAQACGNAGGGGPGDPDAGAPPPPPPPGDGGMPPPPPPPPGDAGAGGGPGGGGERSCSEALGCAERCGRNPQCMQNCFGGVAQASMPLIDAIFQCMGQNNCGMDFGCAQRSCPREIQACRNDR